MLSTTYAAVYLTANSIQKVSIKKYENELYNGALKRAIIIKVKGVKMLKTIIGSVVRWHVGGLRLRMVLARGAVLVLGMVGARRAPPAARGPRRY